MKLPFNLLRSMLPKNLCYRSIQMIVLIIPALLCMTCVSVNATKAGSFNRPQNLPKKDVEVKRFWGVPDTTATIGKLFNYSIPEDAFTGQVDQYKVLEAGESTLPKWLKFDQTEHTFLGVPTSNDQGQYYISVKAFGPPDINGHPSVGKDIFSIEVVPELPHFSSAHLGTEFFHCPKGESITVASVFVDSTFNDLTSTQRVDVISKLASLAGILGDFIKISPLTKEWKVFDESALLAGPGTVKSRQKAGVAFQWQVGCFGLISPSHKSKISDLEWLAANGSLGTLLGYSVIGWNVVSQQPLVVHRERREVNLRGTPVPEAPLPTKWPTFSEIDGPDEPSEETEIPESRVIPTMASPSFMLPSHRHRHHHGEDFGEAGQRNYRGGGQVSPSPTYYYHHLPTTKLYSPMMTPVFQPERPTVYFSPSVIEELQPSRSQLEEMTPVDTLLSSPVMSDTESSLPTERIVLSSVAESSFIQPTKTYIPEKPTKKPIIPINYKPTVQNHIKKLQLYTGQVWSWEVPEDTFSDYEDGSTRNLKLIFMTVKRMAVSPSLWIQFDPERQKLYALPFAQNIGKYDFILEAMDSHGMSTFDQFQIQVLEDPSQLGLHHEFIMTLKYEKWRYLINIDWEIEVVKKLAKVFGDEDTTHISVQSVTQEPPSLSWTNFSLPNYPCPQEAIGILMRKLVANDRDRPSKLLRKTMKPEFNIQKIDVNFHGICDVSPSPTDTNFSPRLQNPVDTVKIKVGEILQFTIPENTFYDIEDGNTINLQLLLLTSDNKELAQSSWIQFNSDSQVIFGLPFEENIGSHEYQLIAIDGEGKEVSDVFVVTVESPPHMENSVEFSVHIDTDFGEINQDMSKKILVAHKLASVFGDPNPQYLQILSITNGSVVYTWTNNTLPSEHCPEDTISELINHMLVLNKTVSERFIQKMGPEFKIDQVNVDPQGACIGVFTPISAKPEQPLEEPAVPDDDIYITTVIPAVVIVIMLIIAVMVACFLYRRRRKGKMKMEDSSSFMNKGVPIIFADELDEKPKPAKSPSIMKEEKPPLSSPENGKTAEEAAQHIPLLPKNSEPSPDSSSSPLYHPPPPFTTNRDSKNTRPKTAPTYRQPPPYVPP
ncbi:dystroglycan-like [Limulus polyphemus]|uniref:Dystroglycan 1 n=1 Tax=Limulus polyphemus TaxID=6850 RepID=A0ABM1SZ37_LIMPO|nr:dystroglycan-like [Limulus polyphemus]XP_013780976.1 dystroglycan-like [Limulus polyphemus]XP_022248893.1 dystroglycan-like [Limulus polyphemus]